MHVCGDLCGVSKSAAWRSIHIVIESICKLRNQMIKFPTADELVRTEAQFRQSKNFPGVLGCIDGSHIAVKVLNSSIRETYRNRKGYFSLNVQMICGPDSYIYDVVSSWPGAAHDSNIFNRSLIARRLRQGEFGDLHLLGDSAYKLTRYMLTPYKNPDTAEKR